MPAKEPNNYSKIFTKILHDAHKHWGEISYDPATKKASGILIVSDGRLFTAELSYDDIKNRLSLTVRLPFKKDINISTLLQIIMFQNQHRNFPGFLTLDCECKLASIIAKAPIYNEYPSLAVSCIFNDTYDFLENNLNELLN